MRPELQDIVDEVSRLLLRPATLEDRNFNLVAFCSHEDPIDEVRQNTILRRHSSADVREWFEQFGIAATDHPVHIPASPDRGLLARLCLPARWNGVTYGYLWLLDEHNELRDADVPAAVALAGRAGALMAQDSRVREDLGYKLQDLLSTDHETAEQAAQDIHDQGVIQRGTPVAAIDIRLEAAGAGEPVPARLSDLPRSILVTAMGGHTVVLVPLAGTDLSPATTMAQRVLDLYRQRLAPPHREELAAGVGAPRADLVQAHASWQEARVASRAGHALPQFRPVASWADLGVYRLLGCGTDTSLANAILDPAVLRLLEHDDTDLRDTATVYLQHGGNVQQSAAALNVHRQTVYYRLGRIEQITGLDLARGDQRLLLHLGLTMAPLLADSMLTRDPSR
ncbi:PucR family transcriptional regulator [Phytoactinopolyspora mesophila]|uniref:PucR family transcriptional regulator n=1 Tax=Phytoactinopolyspora mesophila TaxID=2650750 RepID=A0A7K3LZ37_9ACTN|nr:helix-turn-helix domain-containing protein [Phytoactinopolyspora mesophila]NDL56260.1 PucR family transcriptional regulator [Phytoactinopolyspora mesophila]